MPTLKTKLFAAAGLAALSFATPLVAQAVGVTAVVRNNVQVTTAARPALHKAAIRETISIGNDIVTGGQSMTQLLLLDRTSLTVGASARVRIDRFVFDSRANQSAVAATVAKGAFRFMSGAALNKGKERSSISTPVASIGIRGTIVEVVVGAEAVRIVRQEAGVPRSIVVDPETATLITLRGPGRNAQGAVRGAIDIETGNLTIPVDDAGMAVFIPGPGQQPIGPFLLSGKGIAIMREMLGPQPLPGGNPGWQPDPTSDRQFECSANQDQVSSCSALVSQTPQGAPQGPLPPGP